MEREQVLKVIEKYLINAVDEVEEGQISPEKKLTDYGANSLDIVEIVSGTMRELKIKIPRPELNDIENIDGLIDKFVQYSVKN